MKVKFIESLVGVGFAHNPGDVAELPEKLAKALIADGVCEQAAADAKVTHPVKPAEPGAAKPAPTNGNGKKKPAAA